MVGQVMLKNCPQKICFLDRDGVINIDYPYVGTIDRFKWCEHAIPILKRLIRLDYKLVIVTNQSGINRGYYKLSDFFDLSFFMMDKLKNHGIEVEINFCPHTPDEDCRCRKPNTGMIEKYSITNQDILIGDKHSDMVAALRSGITNRWLVNAEKVSDAYTKYFQNHEELRIEIEML